MILNATVSGWTDAGHADMFRDENGDLWRRAVDAMDGTIAVEEVTEGDRMYPCGRAGIFVWARNLADGGDITIARDGDYYGVNCTEEYVCRDGEWIENEAASA